MNITDIWHEAMIAAIIMENIEILNNSVLFKGTGKEDIEQIVHLFQERQIGPNTIIFTENMPAEALYIIKTGTVRITVMAGEGVEKGLLLLGPGDFFGELSLVLESNRLVTARAETAAELLLLSRKDFQVFVELEPRASLRLLTVIAKLLAMRIKKYSALFKDILVS